MDLTRTYCHKGQADILADLEGHSGRQLASAAVPEALGNGRWEWVLTDIVIFFQKCLEKKHQNADSCPQRGTTLSGEGAGIAATQKYSYFWTVPVLLVLALAPGLRLLSVAQFLDFNPKEWQSTSFIFSSKTFFSFFYFSRLLLKQML